MSEQQLCLGRTFVEILPFSQHLTVPTSEQQLRTFVEILLPFFQDVAVPKSPSNWENLCSNCIAIFSRFCSAMLILTLYAQGLEVGEERFIPSCLGQRRLSRTAPRSAILGRTVANSYNWIVVQEIVSEHINFANQLVQRSL